uniref:Uncharacterized protein n=1 Tax=Arundo donax TaxID=35708 RepID=A0A0A9AAD2_ARUDO
MAPMWLSFLGSHATQR